MQGKRFLLDVIAARVISVVGISIIGFILLIFVYLFRQVVPLFEDAAITEELVQTLPNDLHNAKDIVFSDLNEQNDAIITITNDGYLSFYSLARSLTIREERIPLDSVAVISKDAPTQQLVAIADRSGGVVMLRYEFKDDFSAGSRFSTAEASYPLGRESIQLSTSPLRVINSLTDDASTTIVGHDSLGTLHGKILFSEENTITGEIVRSERNLDMPYIGISLDFLQLFDRQQHLLLATAEGSLLLLGIRDGVARIKQEIVLGKEINDIKVMLGGNSILIAEGDGRVSQWFLTRQTEDQFPGKVFASAQEGESFLQLVRSFSFAAPIEQLIPVTNSKSFIALSATGNAIFTNAPSGKQSFDLSVSNDAEQVASMALSPRANGIIVIDKSGQNTLFRITNPHPDISWKRLYGKVWYEGYDEPSYVWQSTSGSNDFEPKYSLVPLTFGTLKAAAYAMIFSVPLAIAGAIYTAFFMGSRLRRKIKPVIEMMEAFPTVILGFIAGIIIAPYFERNLPGVLSILLFLPPSIIAIGFAIRYLRSRVKLLNQISEVLLVIPFLVLISWLLVQVSPYMENALFGGNMRTWLGENGFDYNQRNALVIGVAMGLAVIPTIFSIAEDAIYSVPRLMVNGAYALGATPLQNTITIVIPAALSGILSAIMIGFGRAVGETMIVLMATGNTPVMDASIFTGMRTLAANIAVEMPEAAAGSTHFRVLFMCGLILLVFTFLVNIIAELVRQRIRRRYANV